MNEIAARTGDSGHPSVILLVDSAQTMAPVAAAGRAHGVELPVCIDIDAGFWALDGRVKIGPKRSPVREPGQAAALAELIEKTDGVQVAGIMAYDGQIAGVGDRPAGRPFRGAAIRVMQAASRSRRWWARCNRWCHGR